MDRTFQVLTYHLTNLKKRTEIRILEENIPDFNSFRFQIGKIRAFEECLKLVQEMGKGKLSLAEISSQEDLSQEENNIDNKDYI